MAIVSPQVIVAEAGQDLTVTVSLSPHENVSGWTVLATLRAYNGGTVLASKTIGSGITVTSSAQGVFVITFLASDLDQTPGAYVWEFTRTNAGYAYPIVEPSAFIIRNSSTASPTLTNLSELSAYLQVGTLSTAEVPLYLNMLYAAEEAIKRICQRSFTRGTYTEYLDTVGQPIVTLRETPVISITSVYLDTTGFYGQAPNAFPSTTQLTQGTDFALMIDRPDGYSYAGRLYRIGHGWPLGSAWNTRNLTPTPVPCPGALKVTYVGGYSLIPYDLKQVVYQIVADRRGAALNGISLNSESFEGYSYSLGTPDSELMKIGSVGRTLNAYRRIVIGV